MKQFKETLRQQKIMKLITEKFDSGEILTIDDIKKSLHLDSTKQALQFSLRYLEEHGMLTRFYKLKLGKKCVFVKPTLKGLLWVRSLI